MSLSDADRLSLEFMAPDGNTTRLKISQRNTLRALQAFYLYKCCENRNLVDWMDLDADAFSDFVTSSAYDPNSPVMPYLSDKAAEALGRNQGTTVTKFGTTAQTTLELPTMVRFK